VYILKYVETNTEFYVWWQNKWKYGYMQIWIKGNMSPQLSQFPACLSECFVVQSFQYWPTREYFSLISVNCDEHQKLLLWWKMSQSWYFTEFCVMYHIFASTVSTEKTKIQSWLPQFHGFCSIFVQLYVIRGVISLLLCTNLKYERALVATVN
jgi:hypothetical protein